MLKKNCKPQLSIYIHEYSSGQEMLYSQQWITIHVSSSIQPRANYSESDPPNLTIFITQKIKNKTK